MNWRTVALSVVASSAVCVASTFGQTEKGGEHPQGPPPEAFTACKDKKEGDKAEFTGRQGQTVTGTCERERQGNQLVLRPDHPPQHGGQAGQGQNDRPSEPPPEAFAACKNKKEGDKAEFTGRQGQTVTGTCEQSNGRLFLRPDHPPKGERAEGGGHSKPTKN
jgi:hypothetical protein